MCFPGNAELLDDPNIWVADTGATVHSTPHEVGFRNTKAASPTDLVIMGSGADVGAKTIAQLPGVVCDKNGCELQEAVLDDVTHLPRAKFNLFSLSKMTRHGGWKLRGDKEAIWIEKDGQEIRFDIIILTPKGALYCMYYKRASKMAISAMDQGTKMNIMNAHDLLGHCSKDTTWSTTKSMGWGSYLEDGGRVSLVRWRKPNKRMCRKKASTKRRRRGKIESSLTLQLSRRSRMALL
jgi:hypothetical protein